MDLLRSSAVPLPLPRRGAVRFVAAGFVLAGAWVLYPFIPALVLAGWVAALARPLVPKLTRRLRDKERAATVITSVLVLSAVLPLGAFSGLLVVAAKDAYHDLTRSPTLRAAFASLTNDHRPLRPAHSLFDLAQQLSQSALTFASDLLLTAGDAALQVCVLVLATHAFLAFDRRIYGFFLLRAPIAPKVVERLAGAYHETGRGLLIGTGLTCLVQGAVATGAFVALDVPRPFVLGGATFLAAFVPSVGTAIVWCPVAALLYLSGETTSAALLLAFGVLVIGTVDNVLRPWFAQRAQLSLPPLLTLLSMLGGMVLMGGYGVFLGPLAVRLGMEAMDILREESLRDMDVAQTAAYRGAERAAARMERP